VSCSWCSEVRTTSGSACDIDIWNASCAEVLGHDLVQSMWDPSTSYSMQQRKFVLEKAVWTHSAVVVLNGAAWTHGSRPSALEV
jgi:hypothetical protein